MKLFTSLLFLGLAFIARAQEEKSAWGDIKAGSMQVFRGATKGVKKAADKLDKKIEAHQKEEEAEERAEKKAKDQKE